MSITAKELEELRIKAGIKTKTDAAKIMGVNGRTYQNGHIVRLKFHK